MQKISHITILDEFAVNMEIVLGQGSNGCVYQGLNMKTGAKVAVKIIDLRTLHTDVARCLLNMEKCAIMSIVNSHVLQGLRVTEDSRNCFIITEFYNGGTLNKEIMSSQTGYLSEARALEIVRDILLGYRSLVEKGIVHRDLKPSNIMLHNDAAIIIDFGFCQIKGFPQPKLEYRVGSPSYMAPESFHYNIYHEKSEIWSIGIILFECVTGKTIDGGRQMSEVYRDMENLGIPFPSHVGKNVRNIINWCLCRNPHYRPTCEQLLQTYFHSEPRAKSKLSPYDSPFEKMRINTIPSVSQELKKQIKGQVRSKMGTNQEKSPAVQMIPKNKQKSYKIPSFLQASIKAKRETINKQNHLNKTNQDKTNCKSNHKYAENRMLTNKDTAENRPPESKIYGRTTAAWFREHKLDHQQVVVNPSKKLNISDMCKEMCKDSKKEKPRLLSNHQTKSVHNVNANEKHAPCTKKVPNISDLRNKKTTTEGSEQ